MRQFLYFLPDQKTEPDRETLLARGLGHAFRPGEEPAHRGVRGGPGGAAGMLVARATEGCEYAPARQAWIKIPQHDAWCGVEQSAPPRPEDLTARDPLIGLDVYRMPLGDGNAWQLPTAILPGDDGARGQTALPQARGWTEDGRLTRAVKPEYRELYAAADEIWSRFEVGEAVDESREAEIALMALAVNYRVGKAEATALALLDETAMARIFRALVALDAWPSFREMVEAAAETED